MITAATLIPDEDDPLRHITDAVADDPAVAIAKIDYLRSRGESGAWRSFARKSHAHHLDDENLARAAAEANIDEAAKWAVANDRRPLDDDLRTRVLARCGD